MAIVGEQFEEYGDHICGAVVNVRQKGDKVYVGIIYANFRYVPKFALKN